ncbi:MULTISPECIES: Hcp family type VI secretion system effector [Vibrio]|uniref:Hcp family type VI secretion system effector n=1 Tax=Vibrio neptunius TaxID=170651 RepID=A0ABS3A106_9VIBR|nr:MULTISPECIES: Hcp family type VI secretion system effector [Vibrio]MBN3492909.1 Hcp family type VI secretion system effector [Vibrio neptunius]MBN3515373.1 Hcp family type VI secretion system effector [Vibrio neptunius]MBN3549441.1 Hcp family type VI secretion system effector [Vibrio neptunius]MBN3577710.1 Hcp family type VI secretion system effector [Vibrio neptunius]MCH9871374.1 Hcp family type VI secretion system effector [Vibrio neptunius]
MSTRAFLSIESVDNGCLSHACNTPLSMGNSYQSGHEDQITVLSFSHSIDYDNKAIHHPIQIVKKIDKASPILAQACSDGDELKCCLNFYRPSSKGGSELFYEVKLTGALIRSLSTHMPHVIDFNDNEMNETMLISYRDISWRHIGANTGAFSSWLQAFSDVRDKDER